MKYTEGKMDNITKEKDNKNISLEQYVMDNQDCLCQEFCSCSKEGFISTNARDPENPEHTMKIALHESQVERLKATSDRIGMPVEELAYRMIMYAVEESEDTPAELRMEMAERLDRQNEKIRNNINKEYESKFGKISVKQLKIKLRDLHYIPLSRLDAMERSWRKELHGNSEEYDIESYLKMKFLSMEKK
jgi:hypothetical protein